MVEAMQLQRVALQPKLCLMLVPIARSVYMLKGFCLLHIWFLFTHSDSLFYFDSFLMMIFLSMSLVCLSRFLMKNRNLVKWANWPQQL